jgi:hypothetical protein
LVYRVEILVETRDELRSMLSRKEQEQIISKLRHIANNIPASLKLRGVTLLKGTQTRLSQFGADAAYEVRIGSGHRAAFVVFEEQALIVVYMVGTHDYANKIFLQALSRLE